MSSRINIARPQGTYSPDPHGFGNSRPSTGYRAADPDDPLEKIRAYGKQIEDAVEIYTQPLKPHLPAIGRFMIVVTFLEDALRIMTQWSDQLWYLQKCALLPPFSRSVSHARHLSSTAGTDNFPMGHLASLPHDQRVVSAQFACSSARTTRVERYFVCRSCLSPLAPSLRNVYDGRPQLPGGRPSTGFRNDGARGDKHDLQTK